MSDLYDRPALYDSIHRGGAAAHFRLLLEVVSQSGRRVAESGTWLEPACGTGRFLTEASKHGIPTVGFDRSPAMLDFARTRLTDPAIELFEADMTDFVKVVGNGSPFGVVFNLDNTFRHLENDAAATRHLNEVAAVLAPHGLVVIGLQLTEYGGEPIDEDVWTGEWEDHEVTQVVQYLPPAHAADRRETVVSHITVRAADGTEEHLDSAYALRTYDRAQWDRLLRGAALETRSWFDFEARPCPGAPIGYGFTVLGARES